MWITDTCSRETVEIWDLGRDGTVRHRSVPYTPSFYLRLPDPPAHWELLDALESAYGAEECTFRTVHGTCEGYRVPAGREVALAIERQTGCAAELYNVDLRPDHQYLAAQDLVPCCDDPSSRFSPDLPALPFRTIEVHITGIPFEKDPVCSIEVVHERHEHLRGEEGVVLADLADLFGAIDPDVVLFPRSDLWLPRLLSAARERGIMLPFSRTGRYRKMTEKSYWSYGRTEYRAGSLIPDGRILIDTAQSFHYRESGLSGILLGARLTGLSPNLAARFTSGTLISAYEVYEALRCGIAIPFRKSDPEAVRRFCDLKSADRGGMMFQPVAGLYGQVSEIDFTSLYPSIIVRYNLSPETLTHPDRRGFLPQVLGPLLLLRRETKARKAADPAYAGIDAILKWMLVTCFGYTGYKNAKFGQIEVHEKITWHAREILLTTKECAEEMGFDVLHGIVDCLWVQGGPAGALKARIEQVTGLHTTLDCYDWIVFLPMPDGYGAYNRYYGRLSTGDLKIRGIMARRGDTPPYVRTMQEAMLSVMKGAGSRAELASCEEEVRELYREAQSGLAGATPSSLAIRRQVSQLTYPRSCPEASAIAACRAAGIRVEPGMEIGYIVTDARTWSVELDWLAKRFDQGYYRRLLARAWEEIAFALEQAAK